MGHVPFLCMLCNNVWERIGEKTLSTILHSSWERGRVNLIFSPITYMLDVSLSHGTCPISLCALYQCMGKNRRKTLSTILHTSWERGHVNLIFSPITYMLDVS